MSVALCGRRRSCRRVASLYASALLVLGVASADAVTSPGPVDVGALHPRLVRVTARWQAPVSARMAGVDVQAVHFQSSQGMVAMARALSRETGVFQHLLLMPGQLTLSGVDDRGHWLAEVQVAPAGSQGRVSVLRHASASVQDGPPDAMAALLPGLERQVHLQLGDKGRPVVLAGYWSALAPDQLAAQAEQALLAAGWQSGGSGSGGDALREWRRGVQRLTALAGTGDDASFLLLMQRAGERP